MVNSFSVICFMMIFFSALMAASTGPLPEAAASNFWFEMSSPIEATLFTPLPVVTCRKSSFTACTSAVSAPANISTSASLTSFFWSANCRNLSYILSNFASSFTSTPFTIKRYFKAARPERAVSTIELSSIPTSLGSIISYVCTFFSTPS